MSEPDRNPLWRWFQCVRCGVWWCAKFDRPEPYVCPSCDARRSWPETPNDA